MKIRAVTAPKLHRQLQEARDELASLRREQEWQRRLRVITALLPYSGPRSRGWSNQSPQRTTMARIPLQRGSTLTRGEKRVARAAPVLAAHRERLALPQQRQPLAIESRRGPVLRGASPDVVIKPRIERERLPDGRFGGRTDIQNNRPGRG